MSRLQESGNAARCIRPSCLRRWILRENREIDGLLDALERTARGLAHGDPVKAHTLRWQCEVLCHRFSRHLDFEDAILGPALRQADPWGEQRAKQLTACLRDRRLVLQTLTALDGYGSSAIVKHLTRLVAHLRRDLRRERRHLRDPDLLRDDVVGIDVHTG